MTLRKLVTIRQISQVDPIADADAIECLTIEGWKVVSRKGTFRAGDPCVYFEIDCFLPDGNPLWQDLVDKSSRNFDGRKGHVLRTIKLRKQVSQGFCVPLAQVTAVLDTINGRCNFATLRQNDYADLLGVVKYEPPIPTELVGQVKGVFPSFIRKTDQERCQNLPEIFDADRQNDRYEVTLKLDGCSMTVYYDPEEIGGVCSRNLELKVNEANKNNTLVKLAVQSGLLGFMKQYPHLAVQGELMGPDIQGNAEKLAHPVLYVFDIWNLKESRYLSPSEREDFYVASNFAQLRASVRPVPLVAGDCATLPELSIGDLQSLLQYADGESPREGVVFKRTDGCFSFKAISNRYLLKQKE